MTKSTIEGAIKAHPLSMADAARHLNIPFGTFKYNAIKFNLYVPNQSGKGRKLPNRGDSSRIPLEDILNGSTPYKAGGSNMKKKLIQEGLKQDKCEECGQLPEWNNKHLVLQLDHIDGNHSNWRYDNLRILCPNCHTQTPTHSGKSPKYKHFRNFKEYTVDEIKAVAVSCINITELARRLNLNTKNSVVRNKLQQFLPR